ncbi:hypothetical protein GGE66_000270 [Rhizobium leguminosarum]|uniref:Uncharacterized protein n=1 Tax=Rhizobium leguminosarum TaxID=384 RepID=A0A7X0DQH0_RHILE|nr:hypothetical protein [Rhizobium leguminosarum]
MITDPGHIVRTIDGAGDEAELVQRRWSWAGTQQAAGVYFRSKDRGVAQRSPLRNATGDECTEREFLNEEFAQNYAAGQALRLHAIPEKSPISAKR